MSCNHKFSILVIHENMSETSGIVCGSFFFFENFLGLIITLEDTFTDVKE